MQFTIVQLFFRKKKYKIMKTKMIILVGCHDCICIGRNVNGRKSRGPSPGALAGTSLFLHGAVRMVGMAEGC